ncbi:MAG: efflux RND transporter periplasmic adaptor subunit [Glaciimonas sp.]|nr:efflux RND transporter periplasmic adaptor subunit [Glaciimonas sp.]
MQNYTLSTLIVLLALIASVSGCSKPAPKVEEVRPVRVIQLGAQQAEVAIEFSGDVRARVESRLGFRVGGKIVARKVDVGTLVTRGQVLMQLDPQDLQLVQAQAQAALQAAQSNRDLARAELSRYQELRSKNFVSQAVLDAKQTTYTAADSTVAQAQAAYRGQSNQAGYAVLVANVDGVVTKVDAEVGQVVAAGTPVVWVAQAGEKEVVVGIPEDKVANLRDVTDVRVRIWANPQAALQGKLRELSPVADPVTRTYVAKITILNAPGEVKLGMTAYVSFVAKTPDAMFTVPLTALLQDKAATAVWLVENGVVRLAPVKIGGTSGDDVLLSSGVTAGQTIVTAGVNLLKVGQKVKILGAPAVADATPKSAPKSAANSAGTGQ